MQTAGLSDRELVPSVVGVGSGVGPGVGAGVVSGVGAGVVSGVGAGVGAGVVSGVVSGVGSPISHDSISEPCVSDHLRFSSADSTALLAASVAAPSSFSSTNFLNCQE
jgi:hypothetical protein